MTADNLLAEACRGTRRLEPAEALAAAERVLLRAWKAAGRPVAEAPPLPAGLAGTRDPD
jgi:hypothetical protein